MNPFEKYALPIIENLPESVIADQHMDERQSNEVMPPIDRLSDLDGEIQSISEDDEPESNVDDSNSKDRGRDKIFSKRVIGRIGSTGINDDDRDRLHDDSWAYGVEALAFYKSIHFLGRGPFTGKWGIFIFAKAAKYLAEEINLFYPNSWSFQECTLKALKLLHRHERYHWYIDAWTLQHEALSKSGLYSEYINFYYSTYFPYEVVEEALANRHAYNCMKREGLSDFMDDFMGSQPGMYSRYYEDPSEKKAKLASHILDGSGAFLHPARYDQEPWIGTGRPRILDDAHCPVYIIYDCNISSILPPNVGAPGFSEYKSFVLNYLNGSLDSATDHQFYRIDNGEKVKMPNPHGQVDRLKPGEFTGSLKKAGMKMKEYRDERRVTRQWRKHTPRSSPKPPIS